jgi:1-acyl-sn-glycerol-3-phosphate acyltransferase
MTRRLITALVRLIAKIFFRRIEIAGLERVPQAVPVIFAVNHPNALIDPLFLLSFTPRHVSFLAKAPLFGMPLIGWFARALDAIPVYRRQDNAATASNRETFARARSLLERGGAIAMFPEGTSHSDPRLRELKTGAARIALGASIRVSIVPTGLYYTAKQTFRSSALMFFGTPINVDPQPVDENGEPRPESVDALTSRIESSLAEVTLQADSHAALELIARAERIFSADGEVDLTRQLELRKRFIAGYTYLRTHQPARLAQLEWKVSRIDAERLAPTEPIGAATTVRLLLLPIALVGAVIHWPVYRLIRFLAARFARQQEELIATIKGLGGLLLFPLLWIVLAVVIGIYVNLSFGIAALVVLPMVGYIALVTFEAFDDIVGRLRAMRHRDLRAQQRDIREEIMAVAREMSPAAGDSSASSGVAAAD